MAHFVSTTTSLTSKAISKESEKAFKFKAKTKLLTGAITAITGAVSILTPGATITAAGIYPAGTTVVSVNASAKTAVLSHNAEKEGTETLEVKAPVFKPYIFTSQPVQTDFAEYITGTVTADQVGALQVEQSFDYPQDHENAAHALELAHWDISTTVTIAVAGEALSFQIFSLAPYFRVVYTNGEAAQGNFRLSARAQEKGLV